jgi:hypothetical protein
VLNTRSSKRLTPWPKPLKADFQTKFTLFLLYGFFLLDKVFVYISFPLTALVIFDRRVLFDRVYAALTRREQLSGLVWMLLLSTMAGIAGVAYGFMSGYPLVTALEVFVFNICPWFLLLGIHAGAQRPSLARDYIRFMAWVHAFTTPLYYLFLRHVTIPGTDTPLLQPGSGALILLGLFCFEKKLSRYWFPIVICSFDTIAIQIRADWLALAIAVVVWAIATKQMTRVVSLAGIIVALLVVGFIADVRIPAIPGRGGEISARDTIGRALSGLDPELAREYSSNSQTYAGTIQWRENWWKAIREAVFEKPSTAVFGLGYGYPIGNLVPYIKGDIRSPHSVLYFTLTYSGLAGVLIFSLLQMNILLVLWKTFKQTGQIFGFTCLIFLIVGGLFGNFFESPQRSVPTYLLLGMCLGPLFISGKEWMLAGRPSRRETEKLTPYTPVGESRLQPTSR